MNPVPIIKWCLVSSYSISSGMESASSGIAPSFGIRGARSFGSRGGPGGRPAFRSMRFALSSLVSGPLPHVARHIMESELIGLETSYRCGVRESVVIPLEGDPPVVRFLQAFIREIPVTPLPLGQFVAPGEDVA